MLHRYVSLDKYGDLCKIIIKKVAQTDVGRKCTTKKFCCNNVSRNGDPVKDSCAGRIIKRSRNFFTYCWYKFKFVGGRSISNKLWI